MNNSYRRYARYIFSSAFLSIAAGMWSCTDDFDLLNTPENVITTNKIDVGMVGQIFAGSLYHGLQGDRGGWELMHELHSDIYAQIFATTSSGFDTDQFAENSSWVNSGWTGFYSGPAVSLNYVQRYTAENNMPAENAVANIWSVMMYQRMTDFFGPIIYSDFGNGATSVAYDKQSDIYYDFFDKLDKSVATLSQHTGQAPFGTNDIIFGGNVQNWIRFANTIRLRVAIRLSYVDPARAKSEAEKAVQAGVMLTKDHAAMMSTTENSVNIGTQWTYINPFCMSATSESFLKGYNDPRLPFFFNQGGGRLGGNMGYNGVRNGLPRLSKTTAIRSGAAGNSFVATQFLPIADGGSNPPYPVMTAAEAYFIRAEGALRGWNMGGTAEELYELGIKRSLEHWTDAGAARIEAYTKSTALPSAVPDVYKTPPASDIPVKFDAAGSFERKLEQIITQKWLDLHLTGWECWAERRRTGYPKGYAVINSLNPNLKVTDLVRRVSYPPSEFSNNAQAVNSAISNLLGGANNTVTRLWWDKKPLAEYPDLSATIPK